MPEPCRHVFIAWSERIAGISSQLEELRDDPDPDAGETTFGVLGLDRPTPAANLDELVKAHVERADGVLAIVDRPNLYVAWEVGFALGRGLPVGMLLAGSEDPGWVSALFPGTLRPHNAVTVEAMVARAGVLHQPHEHVRTEPVEPGDAPLVLLADTPNGQSLRRKIETVHPDVPLLLVGAQDLPALLPKLQGVGAVLWLVPEPAPEQVEDGDAVARTALLVGLLEATGRVQVTLRHHRAVRADRNGVVHLGDPEPFRSRADALARVTAWVEEQRRPDAASGSPLERYRRQVADRYRNPLRWLTRLGLAAAEVTPIDLEVTQGGDVDRLVAGMPDGCRPGRMERRTGSVLALLAEDRAAHPDRPPRWLIKAEPGAGKSTTLGQIALTLAEGGAGVADGRGSDGRASDGQVPDKQVPVFVPLAAWEPEAEQHPDALSWVARRHHPDHPGNLTTALRRAHKQGRLWVLLDGFDECRNPTALRAAIATLLRQLPQATVLLTSRASQVERTGGWRDLGFTVARLDYLDPERQALLTRGLLDGDAAAAQAFGDRMEGLPGLGALLHNPFLLTLCVGLWRQGKRQGDPPQDRAELLNAALTDCLTRGWAVDEDKERPRAWDHRAARRVLRALSVALHEAGGEAWSEDAVHDHLLGVHRRFPRVADVLGPQGNTWRTAQECLTIVHDYAGVFGPLDGKGEPWRYLHRSFRERLVAEAVAEDLSAEDRDAFVADLLRRIEAVPAKQRKQRGEPAADDASRSVELVAMIAAIQGGAEGLALLERLAPLAGDAALRGMATLREAEPWALVEAVLAVPPGEDAAVWLKHIGLGWDGAQLDAVLDNVGRTHGSVDALWAAVSPERSTRDLGVLHYALTRISGQEPERRRFFGAVGRPPPSTDWVAKHLPAIAVEPGTFWMGSPEGEGYDRERPRHRVTLTQGFALGATPVTRAAWAALDANHACPGGDTHPVTEVDWFSARLFCDWVGGRLPTEAEWERACRAGTETRWSCGDDDAALAEHAWYDENSGGETHPVAQKRPNPWGFFDLHGNAWEWCHDRFGEYAAEPGADPQGAATGDGRVLRGGSAWNDAGICRSAYRGAGSPGHRHDDFGFRVCLPPEPGV